MEEDLPLPGCWVISGEWCVRACGHGFRERRDKSEEESLEKKRRRQGSQSVTNSLTFFPPHTFYFYLYLLYLKITKGVGIKCCHKKEKYVFY